jgi:hypothetical protein
VNDPPAVAKVAVAPADHTIGFSSGFGDLLLHLEPSIEKIQFGLALLFLFFGNLFFLFENAVSQVTLKLFSFFGESCSFCFCLCNLLLACSLFFKSL